MAKQPLAFNPFLNDAADGHTQWMLAADIFAHTGFNGTSPPDRDAGAGYVFEAPYAWGENLAYVGQQGALPEVIASIERIHRNLFVDTGIDGRGHRTAMLTDYFRDTGVGISSGLFGAGPAEAMVWMMTQEFATTAGSPFITGVAFADTMVRNASFNAFEGLGGVTIEAQALSGGGIYRTMTWDAGGYTLQVPSGKYTLSAYGGDLAEAMTLGTISVNGQNFLVDLNASAQPGMPSLTAAGVALVIGSAGDDVISAEDLGDRIRVHRNNGTYDFARTSVNAIEIHAALGNDQITIAANLPITGISGDEGNDTILGGSATDYISGGAGNDVINGRFGNDFISGGGGHDMLKGRAGNDTIYGGKGRDSIFGGNHDDSLWGDNAADYIAGEAGNDTIVGGANRDTLLGGSGDDVVASNDGEVDFADGGDGRDKAIADPLLDVLINFELA